MPMADRSPESRGRLRCRSEAVQRETADVDRAGDEDVANEDKPERGLSGGELFAEIARDEAAASLSSSWYVPASKGVNSSSGGVEGTFSPGRLFSQCERLS